MTTTHDTPATPRDRSGAEDRPAVRAVDGVPLPAAGTWAIDPGHAEVAFVGRHFMLTKVRGRFTGVAGEVVVADDPADSRVRVVIDMASVDSGNPTRDEHLRSAELFDVAAHPTATYVSRSVRWSGASGVVDGELTLHGVTRPVPLRVDYLGHARDPWGADRAVFSATARVDREEFGVSWNAVMEAGGVVVSREIAIEIELETVLQR